MPAAVTRPIIEVTRLGDPLPQQETHQTASQGSTIAEYAIKAIADGFRPGVSASEQGSDRTKRGEPASDETRSTVALIPEHSLNEAEVGVSEEYMSLRSAGLSREEALARSDKASMWVDGERVDSRIIQVGALNVCSRFKHANKICQTTAAFNEGNNDAITALTRFPTATPAPILLVISLAAQLALLLTITCSLIPFSRAAPHIKYRLRSSSNKYRGRAYARYGSHTDSVQQLIDHRPFTRIESEAEDARIPFGLFAYAFVALWLGSFAFGVAGADVLLVLTLEAKNSARVMEEKAVLEAGSYLLGVLSFVLLLPLIFFLVPYAIQYRSARSSSAQNGDDRPPFFPFAKPSSAASKEKNEDNESVKSFSCTPYVLPYSRDVQVIRRADEDRATTAESKVANGRRETRLVKAHDGEWEIIILAPRTAHLV